MPQINHKSAITTNFTIDTPEDYQKISNIWDDNLIELNVVTLYELARRFEPKSHAKMEK